jgi:hypothetical protein
VVTWVSNNLRFGSLSMDAMMPVWNYTWVFDVLVSDGNSVYEVYEIL